MDEIKREVIKISSIEDTGVQVKFKGDNGHTYSFFKNKKSGDSTLVNANYSLNKYRAGDTVEVSYTVVALDTGAKIWNVINIKRSQPTVGLHDEPPPPGDEDAPPAMAIEQEPSGPNWVEIGRVKALCGMVNARLRNNTAQEVLPELSYLRQLLKHIESVAKEE